MKNFTHWRFLFFYIFFTLFFLFYPGDNYQFHIFAYHRLLFQKKNQSLIININNIPYIKNRSFQPNIFADGVYVVDLNSFTPIYKKNVFKRFHPASLTKIITALVTFDVYSPQKIITIKNPITEGQIMNLVDGEKITVENLLYGILIHSANDAAFALAQSYGKEKFINLMNKKAESLFMKNSHFDNPAGFDSLNHYSTPFDIALASRELLKNPYLAKMTAIKEITISDVDFKYYHHLINVNNLLGEVPGLGGLKTGYTEEAGQNLVSFYKNNGHQFVIVVLKSEDRFAQTKEIINWINNNIDYLNLKKITLSNRY